MTFGIPLILGLEFLMLALTKSCNLRSYLQPEEQMQTLLPLTSLLAGTERHPAADLTRTQGLL